MRVGADTIVVFDTHWYTTFEHIVTAHARRSRPLHERRAAAGQSGDAVRPAGRPRAGRRDRGGWPRGATTRSCTPPTIPYIGIHYPTVYLTPYLQRDEAWISIGVCQTGDARRLPAVRRVLREAVAGIDRRVVLLASGGLSHRFWPLREIREHEGAGVEHIIVAGRGGRRRAPDRAAGGGRPRRGARRLAGVPHVRAGGQVRPLPDDGRRAGRRATAPRPGVRYSDYESAAGTGQVHIWFDTVASGETDMRFANHRRPRRTSSPTRRQRPAVDIERASAGSSGSDPMVSVRPGQPRGAGRDRRGGDGAPTGRRSTRRCSARPCRAHRRGSGSRSTTARTRSRAGATLPTEPHLFGKTENCVCGPFDDIIVPAGRHEIDYEAELVIVFGRTCTGGRRRPTRGATSPG